jgi:hypothetical protein
MDPHYNAFLQWLRSKGATQEQFEEELAHNHTPIDSFVGKIHQILSTNGTMYQLWASDYQFFTFGTSILGGNFWRSIFPYAGVLEQILAPYYPKPLINEAIFIKFLKHHRIYTKSSALYSSRTEDFHDVVSPINLAFQRMFLWPDHQKWAAINLKWQQLVKHFNLTDTIDYSKIF